MLTFFASKPDHGSPRVGIFDVVSPCQPWQDMVGAFSDAPLGLD